MSPPADGKRHGQGCCDLDQSQHSILRGKILKNWILKGMVNVSTSFNSKSSIVTLGLIAICKCILPSPAALS